MQSTQQAYLKHFPEGFADTYDVILSANGRDFAAHSQFLASQSRFFANMFRDLGHTALRSSQQKLRIPSEALEHFSPEDIQAFLHQVYAFGDVPLNSAHEAYHLFKLADLFDAPRLRSKCHSFMETHDILTLDPGTTIAVHPGRHQKQ